MPAVDIRPMRDEDVVDADRVSWRSSTGLDAGLRPSPDGPMFAGGDLGPLAPYVPSGAYL